MPDSVAEEVAKVAAKVELLTTQLSALTDAVVAIQSESTVLDRNKIALQVLIGTSTLSGRIGTTAGMTELTRQCFLLADAYIQVAERR